jgi:hypothetical protein
MNDRDADLLQSITTGNAGIQSTPLRPTYEEVVPEIMVRPMHSFVTGESSSQMRYVYKIASPPAEMRTVAICLDRGQPGSREFHPDIFHTQSPTLLALGWGVVATWWVSLFLGIMLAIAARSRSRVTLTASHIFPLLLKLLAIMAIFALAPGIIGYFLQGLGMKYYATAIPKTDTSHLPCRPLGSRNVISDWVDRRDHSQHHRLAQSKDPESTRNLAHVLS